MTALIPFTLLVLAAAPQTNGGSPQQRERLRELMQQVPECLRGANPGDNVPVTIMGPQSRREFNASYSDGGGGRRARPRITLNQALFEPYLEEAIQNWMATECGDEETIRRAFSPISILTHEYAHHFHYRGTYRDSQGRVRPNLELINRFLAIKFNAARRAAQNDPEIRRLRREMTRLENMPPPRNAQEAQERHAKYCELVDQIDARYRARGFPARYPGDGPYGASDPHGGEYFAIAIETLIYNPEEFARTFTPEEQAFLAEHFGECLATFPHLAESYRAGAAAVRARRAQQAKPAEGAGMRRD